MEYLINEQQTGKRLIVLITNRLVNNHDLAHAIHWMAEPDHDSILYLVLVTENDNLLEISRNMATMKAVTAANRLTVEVKFAKFSSWLTTLSNISRSSDEIICQEEQTVSYKIFKTQPLHEFLSTRIEQPIRTMSGYYHPIQQLAKKGLHEIVSLLVFLSILSVFTWFQIRVEQELNGFMGTFYLVITLFLEFGAFWAWYKFAFR